MSEDNYERRDDLSPCDNCKWMLYSDKCMTCKHQGKLKIKPLNTTNGGYEKITT